ncbi:MAG: SRPBCC family protein [Longimicrobiaceae bacterium]
MKDELGRRRTDSASRVIAASPQTIYRAFVDPEALVSWLPPEGMTGQVNVFDAREGGTYRITLTYDAPEYSTAGKTSENADVVQGQFLELVPNERIVQRVACESDDPAFAGAMTMTWSLAVVAGGTEITITCENVPEGVRQEDHDAGLRSTLENPTRFRDH